MLHRNFIKQGGKVPFISPAYSVPRMTFSLAAKLIAAEVAEVIPVVKRLAGNEPVVDGIVGAEVLELLL